ncbi:hypothetical protein SCYAM73S_07714 [Streptomyces cyaneofuscatus]
MAPGPAPVRRRSAAPVAGSSRSAERSRISAASDTAPVPRGPEPAGPPAAAPVIVASAAADATPRTDGVSSAPHGVTHTTACSPSASCPSASRSAATAVSCCRPGPAVSTAPNSRERSAPARASSASSAPIRAVTSMAAASRSSVGPGSVSRSQT